MDEERIAERLLSSLDGSVKDLTEMLDNVGISFSGGLDSSVMASLAARYVDPKLYVVGEEKSHDLLGARTASEVLGLPLSEFRLTEESVKEALPQVVDIIRSDNPVLVSYKLPEYLVCRVAKERTILLGTGADELFGGYSRYTKMKPGELRDAMESDFIDLLRNEIPMDSRIAGVFDRVFEYPYLSADVVEAAMDAPLDLKVSGEDRKVILREVARRLPLPEELWSREKKAAQYGSGTIKLMRRIAKSEGLSISRYLEEIHNK
jgi:asparagine synthase (glutamine-hydrolysing)